MSQRNSQILGSQIPPTLQKTQDLKTKIRTFKNILQEVGIQLSFTDEPHALKREQALVLRELEGILQSPDNKCDEFVNGLKILCKKEKHFRKTLMLTHMKKTNTNEITGSRMKNEKIEQESLMRIFLKVPLLQKSIIDILLNEITNNAADDADDTSWLHLLLNPLCYLPYVKDPEFLTTKLLDILEVATYPAQLEILNSIPEIVPDGQHSETAKELCKLLDDRDEMTGAIVDCLNALGLDSDIRSEVQDRILTKIISGGTSLKVFPILITFLLTDCKSQNLVDTLFKIRNAIDTLLLSSNKTEEKDSFKTLLFYKLQSLTVSSKNISEAWLNMISVIKSANDHKPVDYLILFMLHHTVPFKKKIIEVIFRKRVQNGLFKVNQLEKMYDKYILDQLMQDYFNSIVEIGCCLIRSCGELCAREFTITFFKLLFTHPYTQSIYRRDILDNLIVLAGANDKKTVNTVLKILTSFLEDKDKLRQHTISLMRLLEKLDSLELKHVKEVFEILCGLTCGTDADESMSGMRDEIHMIVRKQLYSTKRSIKHRGIISAVVMARHLVKVTEEQSGMFNPITTINALPLGIVREAGTLLELAYTSTSSCAELTGLYYDQLCSMLINNHLNKYFVSWLYETTHEEFRKTFIVDNVPKEINDVKLSMQYTLNKSSETSGVIVGINIGGLTLRSDQKILFLAPHFRLLRTLYYRLHDRQLDGIDALLGCSVLMPDVDIEDLSSGQAKQVSDCLFHCINWFREIISAFVTQTSTNLRSKVIQRLQNLLEVQRNLSESMLKIPDHKLPISYFHICDSNKQFTSPTRIDKLNNPKKKFKTTVTDTNQTTDVSTTVSQKPTKKNVFKINNYLHPIIFRELDTDVVRLVKYSLTFPEDEITQLSSPKPALNIDHFKFILKDYVVKLDTLSNEKDIGLQHLHMVVPMDMIKDCVSLLKHLQSHQQVLIVKIKQLLESTDGRLDLPEMTSQEALDIKLCFGLILKTYELLFSWPGFQHSSNLEIFKELLKNIGTSSSQMFNSAHCLIMETIKKIAHLHEYCLELSHGVSLVHTMEILQSTTTPNAEVQKTLVSVAEKLLSKRWYNTKGVLENGKSANLSIAILVKVYLSSANVKTISGLVGTLQNQVDNLRIKEDYLHMLTSIDKQNFHIFFNGLCTALLQRVKTEVQSLTNNEHLILWKTTTKTMQGLMSVVKTQETKVNLTIFLKKCIGILKIFLSDGIPILELILRSKPDDVVDIFKSMQATTRFLHHLCCYSKLTKDSSLMALVPKFRLTLETLIYRVKAALAANNCSSAFWMGNLKNRDLQGEDILSQSTIVTETNEENSEEELPDDSDTESISQDMNSDNNGTVSSEVFD